MKSFQEDLDRMLRSRKRHNDELDERITYIKDLETTPDSWAENFIKWQTLRREEAETSKALSEKRLSMAGADAESSGKINADMRALQEKLTSLTRERVGEEAAQDAIRAQNAKAQNVPFVSASDYEEAQLQLRMKNRAEAAQKAAESSTTSVVEPPAASSTSEVTKTEEAAKTSAEAVAVPAVVEAPMQEPFSVVDKKAEVAALEKEFPVQAPETGPMTKVSATAERVLENALLRESRRDEILKFDETMTKAKALEAQYGDRPDVLGQLFVLVQGKTYEEAQGKRDFAEKQLALMEATERTADPEEIGKLVR